MSEATASKRRPADEVGMVLTRRVSMASMTRRRSGAAIADQRGESGIAPNVSRR